MLSPIFKALDVKLIAVLEANVVVGAVITAIVSAATSSCPSLDEFKYMPVSLNCILLFELTVHELFKFAPSNAIPVEAFISTIGATICVSPSAAISSCPSLDEFKYIPVSLNCIFLSVGTTTAPVEDKLILPPDAIVMSVPSEVILSLPKDPDPSLFEATKCIVLSCNFSNPFIVTLPEVVPSSVLQPISANVSRDSSHIIPLFA